MKIEIVIIIIASIVLLIFALFVHSLKPISSTVFSVDNFLNTFYNVNQISSLKRVQVSTPDYATIYSIGIKQYRWIQSQPGYVTNPGFVKNCTNADPQTQVTMLSGMILCDTIYNSSYLSGISAGLYIVLATVNGLSNSVSYNVLTYNSSNQVTVDPTDQTRLNLPSNTVSSSVFVAACELFINSQIHSSSAQILSSIFNFQGACANNCSELGNAMTMIEPVFKF